MTGGSATVYLSRAAWERLDAAQAVVDEHAADANGICTICLVPDPCPPRAQAVARIGRYGQLPRRRPLPGPAGLDRTRSTGEFAWFNRGLVGVS
jgi:hypothetical protein